MPQSTGTLERPQATRGPLPPDRDRLSGGPEPNGEGALPPPPNPARIGVWLLVIGVTILFAAFSVAYLSRRHAADWTVGPIPTMLWITTAILLTSSAAMEWTRASARSNVLDDVRTALAATTALGVAFLIGQVVAWRQLVAAGIFFATNPHSAFFYLLTGIHAVHLLGGVGGLFYTLWKVRRAGDAAEAAGVVGPMAIYWHFVDGLWIYLFFILFWL